MKKYILSVLYLLTISILTLSGVSMILKYAVWDLLTYDLSYFETMKPLWHGALFLTIDIGGTGFFIKELKKIWRK